MTTTRLIAALCTLTLTACGGGGGGGGSSSTTTASTCAITPTPVAITLTPNNPNLVKGASQQLTATGTDKDGKTTAITTGLSWSTTDTSYIKVYANGLVEGVAIGTGTVKASACGIDATTQVSVNGPYAMISAGGVHSVARKSTGGLFAWGRNLYGQLGIGNQIDQTSPTQEKLAKTSWSTMVSGEAHTLALDSCSTTGCGLYAWGWNHNGQLGLGTTSGTGATATSTQNFVDKTLPTKVGSATSWAAVAAGGAHSLGIQKGVLYAWGSNFSGQLGIGSTADTSVPTKVGTSTNWMAVAAGANHSVAITTGKDMYTWGANDRGQLGDGSTSDVTASLSAPGATPIKSNVSNIAAGADHSLMILTNGTLWAWGANGFGQLGNETQTDSNVPVQIGNRDDRWVQIAVGGGHNDIGFDSFLNGGHSLAIKSDGTLWAWGSNAFGQLGIGNNSDSLLPVQVGVDKDWIAVSAGKLHSMALKANGTIWIWGRNDYGQLGNGVVNGVSHTGIWVPTMLPN